MTKPLPPCFDDLKAAWNEKDTTKIRGHLDNALSEDILFADPTILLSGIDAFEKMVLGFKKKFPDCHTEHTSGYNEQNNRFRYNWRFIMTDEIFVDGMDVTHVNESGKICRIDAFFGPVPE